MSEVLIFKHVPFEGPGTLTEPLKTLGIKYREVNLYEGGAPKNLEGCGGLIVMGGPMNVYEETEYTFLKDEDRLIKEALAKKLPMIGVCLGAQLMAKAAGAKVTKGQKKEIGWYPCIFQRRQRQIRPLRYCQKRLRSSSGMGIHLKSRTELSGLHHLSSSLTRHSG